MFEVGAVREPPQQPTQAVRTICQPRQGRKRVAQGVSPGWKDPHPAFGTPLPPRREGTGERVDAATHGSRHGLPSGTPAGAVEASQQSLQPMGPPSAEKTQNRGNEAKKSLKTNEVTKRNCANRTHMGARKARNEAKKAGFGCTSRPFRNRKFRPLTAAVAWEPRTGMVWRSRMRRSVA